MKAIEEIVKYYDDARGVGHTEALVAGLMHHSDRTIFVAHTVDWARNVARGTGRKDIVPLSLDQVGGGKLRGLRAPMVLDHHAVVELLKAAMREADASRSEVHGLEVELDELNASLDEAVKREDRLRFRLESDRVAEAAYRARLEAYQGRWVNRIWDWIAERI